MYYLDTSAAMKLVVAERGSTELRRWLGPKGSEVFSSDLLRTELLRAVRRSVPKREGLAREIIESILLVRISTEVYDRAALVEPHALRSLDAIHLAAAMESRDELQGVVTYDDRLAAAAATQSIRVIAPR